MDDGAKNFSGLVAEHSCSTTTSALQYNTCIWRKLTRPNKKKQRQKPEPHRGRIQAPDLSLRFNIHRFKKGKSRARAGVSLLFSGSDPQKNGAAPLIQR
jgi:hypothetical protein